MGTAPIEHHGDVRRLVLDAALDIITTSGADSLSMREVARRAGVSHQAPYHYFKDRSGIFAAISEEGFTALATAFRQVDYSTAAPTKAGFIAYLGFARRNVGHFRVMFRNDICGLATHESAAIAAEDAFSELLLMVSRTIGVSADEADQLTFAIMLWSQAHGLATLILDGPLMNRLPPATEVEVQIEAVIDLASHMVSREAADMGLIPHL